MSARSRFRRVWRGSTWLRRLSQLGFLGFIVFVAVRHRVVGEGGPVVTPSPEAFCPFGGLETVQRLVTSGGSYLAHTHLSNFVLLLAVLASAIVARGVFCGWICPFGTLQEWLRTLGRRLLGERVSVRQGISYRGWRPPRRLVAAFGRVDRVLVYARYAVLAWILWATAGAGVLVFRDYDPYAALLSLGEEMAIGGAVLLGITAALSLVVERPWCRYACPLGAAVGIASKLSPMAISRVSASCSACSLCATTCPLNIAVDRLDRVTDARCIACGACINACPTHGGASLGWQLRWPWQDWAGDTRRVARWLRVWTHRLPRVSRHGSAGATSSAA